MSNIRDIKNKLRAEVKAAREAIGEAERKSLDEKIMRGFKNLASFRFAEILLAYYPLPEEVNILPLIEEALAMGKRVALPKCKEGGEMTFYYIRSLDDVESGAFGIYEPKEGLIPYDITESRPAIMLIPALAYDKFGYRLGYGRGFYDRFVNAFGGVKAGLCYRAFLKNEPLPRGRFDMAVDYIVTDKGVTLVENK